MSCIIFARLIFTPFTSIQCIVAFMFLSLLFEISASWPSCAKTEYAYVFSTPCKPFTSSFPCPGACMHHTKQTLPENAICERNYKTWPQQYWTAHPSTILYIASNNSHGSSPLSSKSFSTCSVLHLTVDPFCFLLADKGVYNIFRWLSLPSVL